MNAYEMIKKMIEEQNLFKNNSIMGFINSDLYKATHNNTVREAVESYNTVFKVTEPLKQYLNNLEVDKKKVDNNKYVAVLLNDIENLEYQKEFLQKQLDEKNNFLERIYKEIGKSFEPKTSIKKGIKKIGVGRVDDILPVITFILDDINKLLFDGSIIFQWECIFNSETPPTPIKAKHKVTLKDIRYFFDKLVELEVFTEQYITPLCKIKAIEFNNSILVPQQLTQAKKDFNNALPPLIKEIDNIFSRYE